MTISIEVGDRFGWLEVQRLGRLPDKHVPGREAPHKGTKAAWCQCKCGSPEILVSIYALTNKHKTSCKCGGYRNEQTVKRNRAGWKTTTPLGRDLKAWCDDHDVTQAGIAELLGVVGSAVHQWCNRAQYHYPSLENWERITAITGLCQDQYAGPPVRMYPLSTAAPVKVPQWLAPHQNELGLSLRELREAKRVSQRWIADDSNITYGRMWSSWESGVHAPNVIELTQLEEYFGLDPGTLAALVPTKTYTTSYFRYGCQPNPVCLCGCNNPTKVIRGNRPEYGRVKGQYELFYRHHGRSSRVSRVNRRTVSMLGDEPPSERIEGECRIWLLDTVTYNRKQYAVAWGINTDDPDGDEIRRRVHIDNWERLYGPVPEGTTLTKRDTGCDNTLCVNPDHWIPIETRKAQGRTKDVCVGGHARIPENLNPNGQCRLCQHDGYLRRKTNNTSACHLLENGVVCGKPSVTSEGLCGMHIQRLKKKGTFDPPIYSSDYEGVSWHQGQQAWQGYFTDENGHKVYVGLFDTQEEAAAKAALRVKPVSWAERARNPELNPNTLIYVVAHTPARGIRHWAQKRGIEVTPGGRISERLREQYYQALKERTNE